MIYAKSAGGRLQLNTHAHVALHEVALCTGAWLYGVHRMCAEMAHGFCGRKATLNQPTQSYSRQGCSESAGEQTSACTIEIKAIYKKLSLLTCPALSC